MTIPTTLGPTAAPERSALAGGIAAVGATQYAADALGDVVLVAPPAVGDAVPPGAAGAEIESTTSVGEPSAPGRGPVAGQIVEVNEASANAPVPVDNDPYGRGWLFRPRVAGPAPQEPLGRRRERRRSAREGLRT